MKISIITLFPEMFRGPFEQSIIKHAIDKKLVEIEYINIRDFGIGKHKVVDDTPYGGGLGMILKVDVLYEAIQKTKNAFVSEYNTGGLRQHTVLLSASGIRYTQAKAKEYAEIEHLILICGHYEGVDERILHFIDEEISIGDFVVTGGEIPAMLITDSVTRLIKGVFKEGVVENESFSIDKDGELMLEHPQYTKPATFKGLEVPKVLLSGNHQEIDEWRNLQSKIKSKKTYKLALRPQI